MSFKSMYFEALYVKHGEQLGVNICFICWLMISKVFFPFKICKDIIFFSWYLYQMVSHKYVRNFDKFKASDLFYPKRLFFLDACATCSELPSNISTMNPYGMLFPFQSFLSKGHLRILIVSFYQCFPIAMTLKCPQLC